MNEKIQIEWDAIENDEQIQTLSKGEQETLQASEVIHEAKEYISSESTRQTIDNASSMVGDILDGLLFKGMYQIELDRDSIDEFSLRLCTVIEKYYPNGIIGLIDRFGEEFALCVSTFGLYKAFKEAYAIKTAEASRKKEVEKNEGN